MDEEGNMKVHNLELEAVLRRSTPTKLSKTPSTERDTKAPSLDRTREGASLAQTPSLIADQSRAREVVTGPCRLMTSSADLTGVNPTFSEISQPSPAMLSELLKFFSLLDELDRSTAVEMERAA
jgi:hypothetical protein